MPTKAIATAPGEPTRLVELTQAEADARAAEEQAWADGAGGRLWSSVRERRDGLLAASDKTMVPDYPATAAEQDAMKAWRSDLRALPKTFTSAQDAVDWLDANPSPIPT